MSSGGSAPATTSASTSTSTSASTSTATSGQHQHAVEMGHLTDAHSQRRQGLGKIPRVRALLHLVAGDQFTPQTVMIGPYHQEVCSYSFTRTPLKSEAFDDIVVKLKVDEDRLKLKLCGLVDEVMKCYTNLPLDTMDIEAKKAFIEMLLYDGCYLLSFFQDFYVPTETSTDGAGNNGGSSHNGGGDVGGAADRVILLSDSILERDILYLLENQIPLRVLEAILEFLRPTRGVEFTLELISNNVRSRLHEQRYISKEKKSVPVPVPDTFKPSDLLHLVYSYFRRGPPKEAVAQKAVSCCNKKKKAEPCPMSRWRQATEYRKYNVQFKRRKFKDGEEWSILDLDFQRGTLHIPFLRVGAHTWTMLRNLMALEEREVLKPVTAYCVFMSQVACTAEDVQLLRCAKILEHFMPSDEEAAQAFAYLSNGVELNIEKEDQNYLKPVWHHLNKRCNSRMCNFKGVFREKHCSNLFYFLIFLVGVLFLVIFAPVSFKKSKDS